MQIRDIIWLTTTLPIHILQISNSMFKCCFLDIR